MTNMTVGKRLAWGFGAVITMMIIIALVSIKSIYSINSDLNLIVSDRFPKTVQANNVIDGINNIARAMRNVLLENNAEKIRSQIERIESEREIIKENLGKLEKGITSEEGKKLLKNVMDARTAYVGDQNTFLDLVKNNKYDEAKILLLEKIRKSQQQYIDSVAKLIDYQSELMTKAGAEANQQVQTTLLILIALSVIAIGIGIFVASLIVRKLMQQLGGEPDYAAQAVHRIAHGDLSVDMQLQAGDNSSLLYSLQNMQQSLRSIVAEIKNIVEAAAIRGDFSVKMSIEGKAGYTRDLSELLNRLSSVSETGLNDVTRVATALANGDLSQRITQDYPGVFGRTKVGVNNTVDALTKIVNEIKYIVENAAVRGDFSVKMDMNGKMGYSKELAELLNQLSSVTETGLNDVLRVANALAQGDLTQHIDKDYPGTFGAVKMGINGTVANLKELIVQIKDATETINTAAKEISTGNSDLSQRTEEQASSLEETASSMEELTSTVKQNADNAKQANQLAIGASAIAGQGGAVVNKVVSTMDSINESSRKIVDIISVIDGIAFQTNILALNAAVEAARAGEQGRGFAVVAGEVRNLAQRSAAAAKEIKSLIGDSVEKVENGTELVAQAGQTMEEIVTAIKRVTDIMSEITAASVEQSSGIGQVSQAVSQMDEVTQQNAALVEQASAAAESLEEQAQGLANSVSVFKISSTTNVVVAKPTHRTTATTHHKPASKTTHKPAQTQVPKQNNNDEEEWAEF